MFICLVEINISITKEKIIAYVLIEKVESFRFCSSNLGFIICKAHELDSSPFIGTAIERIVTQCVLERLLKW